MINGLFEEGVRNHSCKVLLKLLQLEAKCQEAASYLEGCPPFIDAKALPYLLGLVHILKHYNKEKVQKMKSPNQKGFLCRFSPRERHDSSALISCDLVIKVTVSISASLVVMG